MGRPSWNVVGSCLVMDKCRLSMDNHVPSSVCPACLHLPDGPSKSSELLPHYPRSGGLFHQCQPWPCCPPSCHRCCPCQCPPPASPPCSSCSCSPPPTCCPCSACICPSPSSCLPRSS